MPKKKGQAVLQRKIGARPPAFTNLTFLRKTAIDAKSNVVEDAMRLGIPLADTTDSTECTNINYLHKKFKKAAEVAKDEPTANGVVASEGNRPNGAVTLESSRPVNGVKGLEDVRPGNGLKLPEVSRATNGGWSEDEVPSAQPGRYVCHYCQMVCAKPSVLQKHLRAHTNERPYPCAPCGFAFKTKSNLYKHCRSQAHRVKAALGEPCDSAESDTSESSSEHDNDARPGDAQPRIYKPKFHKATFYQDEAPKSTGDVTPKKITSPEQLEERITKIIRDNQMIFDTMEPQFSRKFLLRQNSREKESSSPKSEVDTRKTNETKSKLALALMNVDRNEHSFSPSYPQVNSENHTYQPLNLTKKLAPPNASAPSGPSHRMADSSGDRLMASPSVPRTDDEYESDIGPLLGTTPLIEAPTAKKRRVQSTTLPPDPRGLSAFNARRLSTSSLPSTLKSLEELSRHPMKQPGVAMFGGEVKIMEGGELRTVRISASSEVRTSSVDSRVVTVANVGLLASGGTLVSPGPPAFHMANILNTDVSGISLTPNVVTPNLAVPGVPQPESGVGVLTIMHGETAIPFVPGMPGPQSLQPDSPRKPKLTLSSLSTVQKPSSSSAKLNVPNDVPKIEISSPPAEEKPSLRKFLRPTSLPLKPGSFTPKRLHQGTTPTVLSLVSPETPRPKKSYGQLFLSGHAYTYLGLKCSTRSYYCTISRPQPMYVMQSPKLPRLSMYSNWKVYSETDSLGLGLTPGQAMACYESRFRTGGFTTADSRKKMAESAIVTHSSSWTAQHSRTSQQGQQETSSEPEKKRLKICNGGYESLEEYTYVRGRGRGRYVCEECGIRCKKPSMLKKHIRTHSDVRPYTCSHCAFAFKTKGNLTKHMASKAHYNRCCELGVDPTPPAISDCDSDRHEESNSSDGESDDSDDDDDSNGGTESLEREAACGLLSLSASPNVSQYVAAGLLPRAALDSGPASYPYSNVAVKNVQVQTEVHPPYRERDETPMDLSQKEPDPAVPTFLSKDSQFLRTPTKPPVELKSPQEVDRPPVPAYLAAGIANAQENQTVEPPGGHMLQAYLTAKALRDVQFKQKLRSRSPPLELPSESSSPPPQPLLPVSTAAHLSAVPSPGRPEEGLAAGSTSSKLVPDASATETPSRIMVVGDPNDAAKRVVVNLPSSQSEVQVSAEQRLTAALSKSQDVNLKAEFFPPASGPNHSYFSVTEDGRSICVICNKTFNKPSQLRLHVNIHYFERPFRCDACGVSFRTRGHLQKHERSVSHHNKVSMNTTFGAATVTNPRPFKCDDCKIAFRIHGHLAKHLRSKMHIMKLECLGKLPFGTYAELERSGYNLNEIDTTDCDNSLESLQSLAQKLYEKDSSKFGQPPPKILDDGAESDGSSSEGLHSEHVQCGMCGDAFDSSAALQIHMIDHGKDVVLDKRKSED